MFMNRWTNPADSDFDKCWHRLGDVRRPAQALAFVDEHEKSIQQSAFGINAPNRFQTFGTPVWRKNAGATVFRLNRDGNGYTVLRSFTVNDGCGWAGLIRASDGALFGTTSQGGDAG